MSYRLRATSITSSTAANSKRNIMINCPTDLKAVIRLIKENDSSMTELNLRGNAAKIDSPPPHPHRPAATTSASNENSDYQHNNSHYYHVSTFHYYVGILSEVMKQSTVIRTINVYLSFLYNLTEECKIDLLESIGQIPNLQHFNVISGRKNYNYQEFQLQQQYMTEVLCLRVSSLTTFLRSVIDKQKQRNELKTTMRCARGTKNNSPTDCSTSTRIDLHSISLQEVDLIMGGGSGNNNGWQELQAFQYTLEQIQSLKELNISILSPTNFIQTLFMDIVPSLSTLEIVTVHVIYGDVVYRIDIEEIQMLIFSNHALLPNLKKLSLNNIDLSSSSSIYNNSNYALPVASSQQQQQQQQQQCHSPQQSETSAQSKQKQQQSSSSPMKMIQVYHPLKYLSLACSNLGDDNAIELVNALHRYSPLLQELYLAYNDLTCLTAIEIANKLLSTSSGSSAVPPLKVLGLEDNCNICDDGVIAIANAIQQQDQGSNSSNYELEAKESASSLTSLNLFNCDIGEKSFVALVLALAKNKSLKKLDIRTIYGNYNQSTLSGGYCYGYDLLCNHVLQYNNFCIEELHLDEIQLLAKQRQSQSVQIRDVILTTMGSNSSGNTDGRREASQSQQVVNTTTTVSTKSASKIMADLYFYLSLNKNGKRKRLLADDFNYSQCRSNVSSHLLHQNCESSSSDNQIITMKAKYVEILAPVCKNNDDLKYVYYWIRNKPTLLIDSRV